MNTINKMRVRVVFNAIIVISVSLMLCVGIFHATAVLGISNNLATSIYIVMNMSASALSVAAVIASGGLGGAVGATVAYMIRKLTLRQFITW